MLIVEGEPPSVGRYFVFKYRRHMTIVNKINDFIIDLAKLASLSAPSLFLQELLSAIYI
jgi:hypothetical protein